MKTCRIAICIASPDGLPAGTASPAGIEEVEGFQEARRRAQELADV
jgi:hypothetical protein